MPFPESQRIIYASNPLAEVICQVRFPTILRIDSEVASDFQERIRGKFPLYEEKEDKPPDLDLPAALIDLLIKSWQGKLRVTKHFLSEDEAWHLSMNRDSLSVTTTQYRTWQEFQEYLEGPMRALEEIYHPAFYSRIGLRYRNLIFRDRLGLQNSSWADLLRPEIAGELASDEIVENLQGMFTQAIFLLAPDAGSVQLQHGLGKEKNQECYIIDSDFFTNEKIGVEDANERLNGFNRHSGKLFRWCITNRLHEAMGPGPVAGKD